MTKILIVYVSETGNTERVAHAIADGVQEVDGVSVELKKAVDTTNDDLLEADGIIVGSPTYYGIMSAKVKVVFDKSVKIHGKLVGKVGAAFTSSGGIATGAETTIISIIQALLVHGMIVQGRAEKKHYGAAAKGSPDEKELEDSRHLGQQTASLAKLLSG